MCACVMWNPEYGFCIFLTLKMVQFYSYCVICGTIYLREIRYFNGNFYVFSNERVYIFSVIHVGNSMSNPIEQTSLNAYPSLTQLDHVLQTSGYI